MHGATSFISLLWVIILAVLVPLVLNRFKWLKIPIVVGEILAGILFGRSGFNLIYDDPVLSVISAFGFSFLMFLAGMEIDFSMINLGNGGKEGWKKNPAVLSILIFGGTLLTASLFALGMVHLGLVGHWTTMALILSTTSLGVVVPVLKENKLSLGVYGQTLLLSALVADFATMFLITIEATVMASGLTTDVLLVSILFVAFLVFYRSGTVISHWKPLQKAILELAGSTSQIRVRGSLALMLTFVALSEKLGAEVFLGAFLAGAVIRLLYARQSEELYRKLDAIGFGFFIPVFFITVGAEFNLAVLISDWKVIYLFLSLLAAAYLVKLLPSLIMVTGFSWKKAISGGFLLSSRLTLIIATAAIGLRLGMINPTTNSAIILIAIVTCSLSPALFTTLMEKGAGPKKVRPVLIAGGNRVAVLFARRLAIRGIPTILLQKSAIRAGKFQWRESDTVQCDLLDEDTWNKAGVKLSRRVVVATENDDTTLKVARFLKATMGVERIVAWVQHIESLSVFGELGVAAVNPLINGAAALDMLINTPNTYQILSREVGDKEVLEVRLTEPEFIGKPLREIHIPGDILILSIRREEEVLVPHGDTVLRRGDCITLLGSKDLMESAALLLGRVGCNDVSSQDQKLSKHL